MVVGTRGTGPRRAVQDRSPGIRVDRKFIFYGQGPLENQAVPGMQAVG